MKKLSKQIIAFFLAGFFAKDIIDDIFFLVLLTDKYPLEIFGFSITATSHKIMLVVSTIMTAVFFYYGLKKTQNN
ncbi:MAG TPA: hypothetical protein PK294_12415 [Ignavibacteria bacterium]|nr:hypothetical protein [Ignavibacteria bacterium]HQY53238.1 hypothetical protein [Ignavibacteria bacterium]HRB01230.1 hypothetical protein [Ignavibacteria bacterium]